MIYLDEFLEADHFIQAVESSSEKLRQIYHLPEVRQLGMVVADAEKTDQERFAPALSTPVQCPRGKRFPVWRKECAQSHFLATCWYSL